MADRLDKDVLVEIQKFDYYIVFMDSNSNYLVAYGYSKRPIIMDFLTAMKELSEDKELLLTIPNLKEVIDYVSFDVMEYAEFVEFFNMKNK
jgi:hypothetical protein